MSADTLPEFKPWSIFEAASLFDAWKTFFPPQHDELKQRKVFSAALSKLEDLGFVRQFSEQPEAWEIRRILKARLSVAEHRSGR